jgi:hypothetical protein
VRGVPFAPAVFLAVASLAGATERRVAPTEYTCPSPAPRHAIDHDAEADACAKQGEPACPGGTVLRPDAAGAQDRCAPPPPVRPAGRRLPPKAKASTTSGGLPPACPTGLALVARPGPDLCEVTAAPVCAKDFVLEVRRGEDRCVFVAPSKKK